MTISKVLAESGSWRVERRHREGHTEFHLVFFISDAQDGYPDASDSVRRFKPHQIVDMYHEMRVRGFTQIDRDSVIESMNDSSSNPFVMAFPDTLC